MTLPTGWIAVSWHAWLNSVHLEVGQWARSIKIGCVLIKTPTFVLTSQLRVMLRTSVATCLLFRLVRQWWSSYNAHYLLPQLYATTLTHYELSIHGWMGATLVIYTSICTCDDSASFFFGGRMHKNSINWYKIYLAYGLNRLLTYI